MALPFGRVVERRRRSVRVDVIDLFRRAAPRCAERRSIAWRGPIPDGFGWVR